MKKQESIAKNLFLGSVLVENLFPFPKFSEEESDVLTMIIDSIDKFMEDKPEEFRKYDLEASQPESFIEKLKELGLFGLIIPEDGGGIGLNSRGYSRALQQVGFYDASTALTIGAHSSIGMRGLILFGNDEQKARYYEKLASGEMIAAFCLTEAGSGSDAASIKTNAMKKEDGSWILSGEKIWITNGPFADFFTVFAKTESEGGKISAFIVEKGYEGVSTGPKEDKMGIRASATSTVIFNNVHIPKENLLGEEGKGFKIAMAILNSGRTGLGGGCVGSMKRCIKLASEQSTNRKQFGVKIADFELIKSKIAQMTVDCFVTESLVTLVGFLSDSEVEDYSLEAAISKIVATENLWKTNYEALQIAGGNGFMKEFPYERITRDSRINMIFEGTNEILRLYVGLSGLKFAGIYLKEVGEASASVFNDPIKGFGILTDYASKKFTQYTSMNITKIEVANEIKDCAETLANYTNAFSKSVEEILKKYKKDIINKQLITARIADICIDLVSGLATISRVQSIIEEKGAVNCESEINILKIFTQQAKRRINQNLRRLVKNEDAEINKLAENILEKQIFDWDVL